MDVTINPDNINGAGEVTTAIRRREPERDRRVSLNIHIHRIAASFLQEGVDMTRVGEVPW